MVSAITCKSTDRVGEHNYCCTKLNNLVCCVLAQFKAPQTQQTAVRSETSLPCFSRQQLKEHCAHLTHPAGSCRRHKLYMLPMPAYPAEPSKKQNYKLCGSAPACAAHNCTHALPLGWLPTACNMRLSQEFGNHLAASSHHSQRLAACSKLPCGPDGCPCARTQRPAAATVAALPLRRRQVPSNPRCPQLC
jgi:hypothetical protein